MTRSAVVIGAGTAGLAAGWALSRAGVEVAVLERRSRVGGRVRERRVAGIPVDVGASFVTNFYPRALGLAREAGLTQGQPPPQPRGAVARGGRLHPVSPPYRLLSGSLLPPLAKLRLLHVAWPLLRNWRELDHEAVWRADRLDTRSVADYAAARLDADVLDYLLAPSLRAFLYWEPEETSQAMLFIMLRQAFGLRYAAVPGGRMSALPEKLAESLTVRLGTEVREVREVRQVAGVSGANRRLGGYEVRAVAGGEEHRLTADGVVCATPATQVPQLFPQLDAERRAFFSAVRYSATLSVTLPARGSPLAPYNGLLLPRPEARHLVAATLRPVAAPSSGGPRHMLTLFTSAEGARLLRGTGEKEIAGILLAELAAAGAPFEPADLIREQAVVHRWDEALPIFDVGHLHALRRFSAGRIENGPLVFAGDYLGGPYLEGAVAAGLDAAQRLLHQLRDTTGEG
jgi:oxygen-dependent protoporphyrinogen oxidase